MKKLIGVSVIILCISLNPVKSQNESFLGLCLGTALPQGTFADNDYQKEGAGYAKTGFLFTFDATWFPDDYMGIGATVTYGSNNPDKSKYKNDLINDVLGRYPNLVVLDEKTYFDFGVWRYLNFHAGPSFTVPIGKFNIDARALAGLSLAWAPSQELQIYWSDNSTFSRKVDPKAIPTLGYTVGGGIRYAFKSGYVLRLITEYTNCKPTIEFQENPILSASTNNSEPEVKKVEMPIKNIHIGLGIAYNFEL